MAVYRASGLLVDSFDNSLQWWKSFVGAWNKSPYVSELAGLGTVRFETIDRGSEVVHVEWDDLGRAQLVEPSSSDVIGLSATTENWRSFLSGRLSATLAVLDGKISYEGLLGRIAPYSKAFNRLGEVARSSSIG